MKTIIKNVLAITNDSDRVIKNAEVVIDGGIIERVGAAKKSNLEKCKVIDGKGGVLLPGFINPHMHLYSAFARGMCFPRVKNFKEILDKVWWRLDAKLNYEDIYLSALSSLIDGVHSGVTTVIDHHASFGAISGSLRMIEDAFKKVGVRGVLCFETSDRFGKNKRDAAFEENVEFIEEHNGLNKRVCGMLGMHASLTLSDESLKMASSIMHRYKVGAHIHVAEGIEDLKDSKKKFKMTTVERLYDAGILREGTLAVHCVHVDGRDMGLLKKSKVTLVHCPVSNLNNAVGIAPYLKFVSSGIPTLIGTDGMSASISDDVKLASILHKLADSDPQAGWCEVKDSILNSAPKFIKGAMGVDLGVIRKGFAADLAIFDYCPPTPITDDNFWAHVMFGIFGSRARVVMVDGDVILREFMSRIDEERIKSAASKAAKKLWQKI